MKLFKSIFTLNQLDKYLLFCQVRPFLFFSSVLVGILWLVQALPRLDDIISNGQSSDVFITVAFLMLPQVMLLVIPIAAFSATIYSINQLYLDSEFTIFMSVGRSNISISKPIIIFGLIIALFMYALSLYLVPLSQQKLRALMFEVRQNLTSQLIKDGRFFHPSDGVSIYIRESNKTGEMRGIFLTDARTIDYSLTYSAREAVLHETSNGLLLVMQDGLLQISDDDNLELSTVSFERLGLSLDEFFPKRTQSFLSPKEVSPLRIVYNFHSIDQVDYENKGAYLAEAHLKLATPLTPVALTLLAVTTFLINGYKRKGFAISIYVAIAIGLAMQASTLSLKSVISENNSLFWVIYVPSVLLIVFSFLMLLLSQRSKKQVAKI